MSTAINAEPITATFLDLTKPAGFIESLKSIFALKKKGHIAFTDDKRLVETQEGGNLKVTAKPLFTITDPIGLGRMPRSIEFHPKYPEIEKQISEYIPEESVRQRIWQQVDNFLNRNSGLNGLSILEVQNPEEHGGAKYMFVKESRPFGEHETNVIPVKEDGTIVKSGQILSLQRSHRVLTKSYPIGALTA